MRQLPVALAGFAALGAVTLFARPVLADSFVVSYEAPGVQNTTTTFSYSGVETFDGQSTGFQTFSTAFGTSGQNTISGTYSGVQIKPADVYGGAGGAGNYAVAFGANPYSLTLAAGSSPIDYFGFWLSALDHGNLLAFYNGASEVFSFSAAQVLALVETNRAYFGNPNPQHPGNGGQPYVFLNFYDTSGAFNKVAFTESPAVGGFESDNQTVGIYTSISGTPVPEPTALALLGTGLFGLGRIRRRGAGSRRFGEVC